MVHAARKLPLDFIINVGDNFYFNGVQNVFDSRIEDSFEEIYDQPELLVPWFGINYFNFLKLFYLGIPWVETMTI
jgi:hypothetical protein